jgi:hypothetical protein
MGEPVRMTAYFLGISGRDEVGLFRTLGNSIGLNLLCAGFSGADYQRGFNL